MAWFTVILQAFGFTPSGPLLESFASWAQGLIGNVAPRSLFAIFQSAAMGGYGVDILGSVTNMFSALAGGGAFARFVYSAFGQAREAGNSTYTG
ncbi:uncharacterized protein FMAN_04798 [Fusarium mangiferae]|uniref:Uncharacterized protein n=1 Tax=Fusarium mangiferae TaxID=192010 RepID=A0A1L7SZA3_FUSMA|nr:uncharacterized protein FMAN_04798 [Fusarium mangiferae]CVK88635.1 uncharacterized protein FMAN_04798 [Fusarium mangiferae]